MQEQPQKTLLGLGLIFRFFFLTCMGGGDKRGQRSMFGLISPVISFPVITFSFFLSSLFPNLLSSLFLFFSFPREKGIVRGGEGTWNKADRQAGSQAARADGQEMVTHPLWRKPAARLLARSGQVAKPRTKCC